MNPAILKIKFTYCFPKGRIKSQLDMFSGVQPLVFTVVLDNPGRLQVVINL